MTQGGAISQTSTVSLTQASAGATLASGTTVALTVNGIQVEAVAPSSSYDAFADSLKLAIDEAANDNPLAFANIDIEIDANTKLISLVSTNPGTPFEVSGAYSSSAEINLTIEELRKILLAIMKLRR